MSHRININLDDDIWESLQAVPKGKRSPLVGKPKSDAHKANIGLARRGKKHADEAKAKMSQALKGRVFSAEWLAKLTLAAQAAF